jgi:hypothetical protein
VGLKYRENEGVWLRVDINGPFCRIFAGIFESKEIFAGFLQDLFT